MPPRSKIVSGVLIAVVGLVALTVIYLKPEGLHVPFWVAFTACSSFVIAGAAIALHSISVKVYQWLIVTLLAAMTAVPIWVAVGFGSRSCTTNIPYLASELSCRVAFGASALVLLVMLSFAILQAVRSPNEG